MYKILFAGAVISTLMLVQAKSEEQKTNNETVAVNNNDSLKKAYETAQKDLAAHEKASTMHKHHMAKLPMIPEEKDIKDFPAALAAEENDEAKIADYYKLVASAYEKEAKTAQETMTRAHEAMSKQKMDHSLKHQRHADRKMPKDMAMHKSGKKVDDKYVPHQSAAHTPIPVHADSQAMQSKRYSELKTKHDQMEMKHKFYLEIANLLGSKNADYGKKEDKK